MKLINVEPVGVEGAADLLLASYDAAARHDLSVRQYFHFSQPHVREQTLRRLPNELALRGFALFRADLLPRGLTASDKDILRVLLWDDLDRDFDEATAPSGLCAPVPEKEAYRLIEQAHLLRKGFQRGYAQRSEEVSSHVSDLLGISPQSLRQLKDD